MSAEVVKVLLTFQALANTIRAKEEEDGVKDTDAELVYEACASSIERVILQVKEHFKS